MLSPGSYRTRLRYNPNYNPKVKFIAKTTEFLYKKRKEKHDFMRYFLHKSRVLVGRGGFEPKLSPESLYFQGIL